MQLPIEMHSMSKSYTYVDIMEHITNVEVDAQ